MHGFLSAKTTCQIGEHVQAEPGRGLAPVTLQDRTGGASQPSCPLRENLLSKEGCFLSLNRLSLASEVPPMEIPYDLANSRLSQTDLDSPDPEVDTTDKIKSQVFMMVRQYSHKIKKANQLLKVKSPEMEQPPASQPHKSVHKDLAAILEDQK